MSVVTVSTQCTSERESLLRILSAAAFLVFFQAYLVAPLVPALALEFHVSVTQMGFVVPAYMLPYGISTLFYGPLSDRIGRRSVILCLLGMAAGTIAGVATSHTVQQLLVWRVAAGIASGGIVPVGLALLGDLFPYSERGRPIGWMFGSMAGGMALGSTAGALLNPIIGWRNEFWFTAFLAAVVCGCAVFHRSGMAGKLSPCPLNISGAAKGYLQMFRDPRATKAYSYIFLNGVFHSGIFSWLGLYLSQRYELDDRGIGLALLGYGLPGMCLGPVIGKLADRTGRNILIPAGVLLASLGSAVLVPRIPLVVAIVAVTVLSLGYDMSHPLLAGIVTSVNPKRRGLAMGMNAFVLFTGFGSGTLLFGILMRRSFDTALVSFTSVQALLGVFGFLILRRETVIDTPS